MKQLVPILICLSFFACASTQQATDLQSGVEQPELLPVASAVRKGVLENGLQFIVRENSRPENRAELRLVVRAGSVLEDEDQQGLAHFVEHMAFNGTKRFPRHELVDYLESIGMRFGADLNAYTDFDETVYMLQVPTDSTDVVRKAFQILEDWAHQVSFEAEEIDRERGVVVEEWRGGRGAGARMQDAQFPILLKDSRYASRLPIGQKAVLDTFRYSAIRRFYRDWYRPDLMAVIAVGDFEADWIEGLIRETFSGIPAAEDPRPRTVYPVPDHGETLFAIASDPEAVWSGFGIYYKQPVRSLKTADDYRQSLVSGLYNRMLNQRLFELTKLEDPPYLGAGGGRERFVLSKDAYSLGARVKNNGIERGLEAVLTEAARVQQHGFTPAEMARQKKRMLRGIEQAFRERDKRRSGVYASEYIRHFTVEEAIPGIEVEYELYQALVPGIRLEEVNRLASTWIADHNRVVMVNGPEK